MDTENQTANALRTRLRGIGRTRLTAVGAAAAVLAGLGVLASTPTALAGPQADTVLPASTAAFWELNTNPGLRQRMSLGDLAADADSNRGKVLGDATARLVEASFPVPVGTKAEIDFVKDIAPWMGSSVAIGALDLAPGETDRPAVLVVDVDDEDAEAKAVRRIQASNPQTATWRDGDWRVFAPAGSERRVKADIKAGAIADREAYRDDLNDVRGDRVLTGWGTSELLNQLGGTWLTWADPSAALPIQISKSGTAKAVVAGSVDDETIVIDRVQSGANDFIDPLQQALKGESTNLIDQMPADATLAVGGAGLGADSADVGKWIRSENPYGLSKQADFLKVDLDRDLPALLGDDIAGAIVAKADGSNPRFVLRSTTPDADLAQKTAKTIYDAMIYPMTEVRGTAKITDDGVVLSNDDALLEQAAKPEATKTLGSEGLLDEVLPEGDRRGVVFYLAAPKDLPDDEFGKRSVLPGMKAIGVQVYSQGDTVHYQARINFEK